MTMWTEDRMAALRTFCAEGWSGSQMAVKLETTRNAIIGKLARMGLKLRGSKSGAARASRPKRAVYRPPILAPMAAVEPEPITMAAPESPPAGPLTLMELRADTCKWPVNDGNPFLFCGEPIEQEGRPYCPAHARKAYSPSKRT